MRKPKSVSIDLTIDYGDETVFKSFPNVQQLADFLLFHPEVGKMVGYVPKRPRPGVPYKEPKTVSTYTKSNASQYNGGKKAAMQFRNEMNGAAERGEITLKPGWDKNLP